MKDKLIRKIQRWAKTLSTPSLEGIDWKIESLAARVDSLAIATNAQDQNIEALVTSMLFERWEREPTNLFSRNELGYWLNFQKLFGEGVEVGVYRGDFSDMLLKSWKGRRLYSADPWVECSSEEYTDICNVSSVQQEENFQFTSGRLQRFGDRSLILRKTSKDASEFFEVGSLDFVYIDAQHHYEAVSEDLEFWTNKVRAGGVIAGHDYLNGQLESGRYGVKKAVDEWAERARLQVHATREGPYPSWFVIKPYR